MAMAQDDVLHDVQDLDAALRAYDRRYAALLSTFHAACRHAAAPAGAPWGADPRRWPKAYRVLRDFHARYLAAMARLPESAEPSVDRPTRTAV